MKYYSESNRPQTIPMPKTSEIEPEYKEVLDKDGKKFLKKTGEVNVYKKIQEAAEGVTLKEIINKYGIDIDDSINNIEENVIDISEMPDNAIDTLNFINEAKNIFENSSKEIKQEFNNNFTEFLAGAQNGKLKKFIESKKRVVNDVLPGQMQIEEIQQRQQVTPQQALDEQQEKTTMGVRYE